MKRALAGFVLLLGACAAPQKRSPRPSQPIPAKARAVIKTAKAYLPEEEHPKKTPKDCSDFVQKVFSANGVELPRTSVEMSLVGERVKSSKDLRMGDLVFFSGSTISRIVGHVGIYINNGIFIHLPDNAVGVTMESLYSDYYRKRYLAARRVIL